MNNMILAVPVLLPVIGGGSILFSERRSRGGRRLLSPERFAGCLVLLNSLIVAAILLIPGARGEGLVLFRLFANLTVMFRIDGMGSVFAGLVAFLWPLATLYSFEYMKHENRKDTFFAFYVMTYGITMGIAFAGNLTTLYLFYEMLTLVTFPLVLFPLSREAVRASRTYLYFSIGGAAFAFIGLVFVMSFSVTGTTAFQPGGMLNPETAAGSRDILLFVYVLAFFGFGVKAAVFPCHVWLPRATVAPTPVTALLHAVAVVKSGAFAILRFTYFNYGAGFVRGSWAQWVIMAAALTTILFGSTMAVREVHWKRRLAYSTISNLSYILFGAALMTPFGLAASLSHLTAHAFMKICSFFCAGAVMHQTGKTYIYELDGLGRRMPVTFACLLTASLSLMGIPLFAGFISKWNLCRAAFLYGDQYADGPGGWLVYAGVAVILYSALMTGIYMFSVLIRAYTPVHEGQAQEDPAQTASDPGWMMLVPLLIFAAVILLIGLHSGPLMGLLTAIGGEAG